MASDSLRIPEYERPLVDQVGPAIPARIEPDPQANRAAATPEEAVVAVEGADESIPEEGVYAPPRPRKVLYSEVVEFRTKTLPRRKPRIHGDESLRVLIDDE
jgi:hypothetical protein